MFPYIPRGDIILPFQVYSHIDIHRKLEAPATYIRFIGQSWRSVAHVMVTKHCRPATEYGAIDQLQRLMFY